ncbi:hypothetical protein Smp_162530 [Schistosoma mansoni]|uniref:hypothetical protein n=1 Tax=Schistosoma mansoni TaxID=6183 RepID=UPI0001A6286A|nr:hypothetical protein Smp_162530 [Schistosoma mansoni]|eukprot:XP_018650913.1 hypothetical protein Smp_162530 [Schistosoma mansoni]
MSESQQRFGNIKRTYNKRCAQPHSIENINPQNWNKSVNKRNNQKCRKPLANLSNTYTGIETECPIKLDRPINKKSKACSASSSYGNTDSMTQ